MAIEQIEKMLNNIVLYLKKLFFMREDKYLKYIKKRSDPSD